MDAGIASGKISAENGKIHESAECPGRLEAFLPTAFKSNHASNIMPLDNGDMLCAWFAGSKEGRSDISIMMSRLRHRTAEWSVPETMSDDAARSEQNPVVFFGGDKRIWLIYTAQIDFDQGTSVVRYRTSDDYGYTWSKVKTLFDKPGSFIRQPMVTLDNGEWLLPMYYSSRADAASWYGGDRSVVKISPDKGDTWMEYEVPESTGLVHMNVLTMPGGRLLAFFRSRKADWIYSSSSCDGGRTWEKPLPASLPNNNSSIQATRLNSGSIALVYNDISAGGRIVEGAAPPWIDEGINVKKTEEKKEAPAIWGIQRAPLTIAISRDGGKTWPVRRNLETDAGKISRNDPEGRSKGEYSYPSVKQTPDGKIHITYTYLRDAIKYVCIDEEWIGQK